MHALTILMEASVRLMNIGATPAPCSEASNSTASHNDSTVPCNCAKHSFHDLSAFGFPSVKFKLSVYNILWGYVGRPKIPPKLPVCACPPRRARPYKSQDALTRRKICKLQEITLRI